MIIKNKFSGYARDGSRIHNMGGGSGANTTYSQTSNIPEYMQPFATKMLGAAESQIYQGDSFRPFQSYSAYDTARGGTGESVAGFTPTQVQAMQGIQNYRLPGQTGAASQMTAGLTGAALQPSSFRDQGTAGSYMSPFIQQALAPQMEEARRQYGITGQQQASQAAQQGAFGGARHGIVEAENARNLAKQQESIYGQGMQQAFGQGQQQYNAEQQQRMAQIQQGLAGAGQLGALGQQQYGQEMGLLGQQQAVGAQQQQFEQQRMNQIVQDYATSQQYPMMQLGVLNSMLRGMPMQASTTSMYQAQPSAFSQMAGAAGTGLGLMQQYNQAFPTKKDGGVIKMASGGITSGVPAGKLPSMLEKLSDDQLTKKDTAQDMDPLTRDMVDTEQARRSRLRGLANGGAVAFAEGSKEAVDEDGIARILREQKSSITSSPATQQEPNARVESPGPTLKELDADLANRGITAESAQQQRVTPAAPVQDTKFDRMLAAANKNNPVTPAIGQESTVAPATEQGSAETANASALKALQEQAAGYKGTMDKSVAQIAKEQQDLYTQMGIVNPAIAEQAGLKERKATVEKDSQELAKSRLIQFLVDWGKTPGSAIKGAINAGSNLVESSIGDEKLRRKMLDDLDAVDRDINKAEYLRKTGDVDKATAIQKEAGAKYFAINDKILEYNAKIELQQMKNELAASKIANKNGVVQQAEVIASGMIAKGAPDNAVTQAAALKEALRLQPSITSAGISAASQQAIAAPKLDVAQGELDVKTGEAATRLAEQRRKQKIDLDEAVANETRARRKDFSAAKKADKAAGVEPSDPKSKTAALKKEIKTEIQASPGFEALSTTPAAAAPQLKWNPTTKTWEK